MNEGSWWERLRWGRLLYRTSTGAPPAGTTVYVYQRGGLWRVTKVRWCGGSWQVWGRRAR